MSTGQWLAQYAAKEFEDALSEAHAFSTSEGVQPLMQTYANAAGDCRVPRQAALVPP